MCVLRVLLIPHKNTIKTYTVCKPTINCRYSFYLSIIFKTTNTQ